jgi:hypothetical protein
VFVGWVVASPFRRLPNGADVELTYSWGQNLLASTTAVIGVALLVAGVVVGRSRRPATGAATGTGAGAHAQGAADVGVRAGSGSGPRGS